ncbi:MAG TPA: type II secretion system protein GspE, partial [Gemmatimonadales bacterium]|nr:type II secretion system protein GspE [Gemmatimonadales bacterium]
MPRNFSFSHETMATAAAGSSGEQLGEVLLREGLVTREQLIAAKADQKTSKHRLGYVLAKLGMVPELEITKVLARQYRMPAVDLSRFEVDPRILKLVPA